jgi:alpha-tubulin suppressor-like RCC1 family protein
MTHACALRKDESLVCWGGNDSGQLGIGTTTKVARNRYVKVDLGGEGVSSFSCGGVHTCAVTSSGALYCWGSNSNAALGIQTANYQPSAWPLENDALKDVVSVFGGFGAPHTCATVRDGRLYCWGHNYYCQLGLGPSTCPSGGSVTTPTELTEWP